MSSTLSELDSAEFLKPYGLPIAPSRLVEDADDATAAASEFGFPVVAKLCGDNIAHKTERGLVRLGLDNEASVRRACEELLSARTADEADAQVLIAPIISGERELICGLNRDEQFGHTVMVGVGGVMTEVIADVVIRLVPIERADAHSMISELDSQAMLGEFRGEPAVDRELLADALMALSAAATDRPDLLSAEANPLIVCDGRPIAVDTLVEFA